MESIAEQIKKIIQRAGKIVIVSHENPDGDAIGSSLALAAFLQALGKESSIWLPGRFPDYYRWMKGSDKIRYITENKDGLIDNLRQADTLFAVDMTGLNRTGKMYPVLREYQGWKVLIDHHLDPEREDFHHVFSDITVSSTSELIFHLMDMMGMTDRIDIIIAEALYVGIMTDTGSFSFNCSSPLTHEVTARLIHTGISPDRIHKLVYDNNTEERIRILGHALNKMKVIHPSHTAYISLGKDELKRLGSRPGDTEGIVNFALSIKGIVLAAFFSVRDREVKISFRSKGRFSVNDFARKHFNGGGHHNAAGGSFAGTIEEAVAAFEALLPSYQTELKRCNEDF